MRINYRDETPPSRDVLLAMAEAARRDEEWVRQAQRELDWTGIDSLDDALADVTEARAMVARALRNRR